jgi:hypothetical protein
MPVCPHCGKNVSEGIAYCPSCGERFKKEFTSDGKQKYIQELEESTAEEKRIECEQEEERKREKKEARKKEAEEYSKKTAEEWAKKPKVARIAITVGFIALIVAVPVILCTQLKATTPVAIAVETLGTPKGDKDSGVISATYDEDKLEVEYQFYPLGLLAVEKEASLELVPMFKKVFARTAASEVVVHVMGPFRDRYGNITWMPVLTLGITRTSFEKINWSNIADIEFYMACDTYWKRS